MKEIEYYGQLNAIQLNGRCKTLYFYATALTIKSFIVEIDRFIKLRK